MAVTVVEKEVNQNGIEIYANAIYETDDDAAAASDTFINFSALTTTLNGRVYTGLRLEYVAMCSSGDNITGLGGHGWSLWQQPAVTGVVVPIVHCNPFDAIEVNFKTFSPHRAYLERALAVGNMSIRYHPSKATTGSAVDRMCVFVKCTLS